MEYEPIVPLPPKGELPKLAQKYIDELNERSRYSKEGEAIEWIFKAFPRNTDIDEVLIKVMALDSSYSTNLRNFNLILPMAQMITSIPQFNDRIKKRDLRLVDELCRFMRISEDEDEKMAKPFSFASKYCCLQNIALKDVVVTKRKQYAIYDSYVAKVLTWYQENYKLLDNHYREKLRVSWCNNSYKQKKYNDKYKVEALKSSYSDLYFPVVLCFQYYCNLTHFSLRELDHFLWRMGQEYFLGYKIVVINGYVIKMVGVEKLKINIYESCSIKELDDVHKTIKYSKKNYERKNNEDDRDYALRLLKEFYVCVMRKEGVVGDYYIEVDEIRKSVKLYHIVYSPTLNFGEKDTIEEGNHKNGKKGLANKLKEKAIEEGYKITKESLQDICKEIVNQYYMQLFNAQNDTAKPSDKPKNKANLSKQSGNSSKNK